MKYFEKPFLPSDLRSRSNGAPFVRTAAALLISRATDTHLRDVLKQRWPHDRDTELVTRAATSPATMTQSDWAAAVVATSVPDFLGSLGPASASAVLFNRGPQFRFGDGTGSIILPTLTAAATNVDFVGEGAAFPVIEYDTSAKVVLTPKKFGVISVFTHETFEHSTPMIETVVRATVSASFGLGLDAKSLDAEAASAIRPAGLRNGIAALTASDETVRSEAMAEDISNLVAAVSTVAGNSPIIIVAAPAQAAALRLWNRATLDYEILASGGLAAGVVVAIASNTLVSAIDPAPRFELSRDTTLHLDTAAHDKIDTDAISETVKSLHQSDLIGLRTILRISWGLRDPAGLAWTQSVLW